MRIEQETEFICRRGVGYSWFLKPETTGSDSVHRIPIPETTYSQSVVLKIQRHKNAPPISIGIKAAILDLRDPKRQRLIISCNEGQKPFRSFSLRRIHKFFVETEFD